MQLWNSSIEAKSKNKKLLKIKGSLPFPPKRTLQTAFPFAVMLPNQSFFLPDNEFSKAEQSSVIALYKRYNRQYSVLFHHYKHRKPIAGIEICRLL